jgi:hypothetical protein
VLLIINIIIFKMLNKVINYSSKIALCMVTNISSHLRSSSVGAFKTMGNIEIRDKAAVIVSEKIFKIFV